ncbi:MAG TPA: DUF1499 domain-containing protein [Verrucomicrobiae bacterium]|nr:DUF1499 domain-containing protein [Verrucomicrobiae bacterium]
MALTETKLSRSAEAGKLKDCPATPNCVCSQSSTLSRRIEPLRFAGSAGVAWAKLQRLIESMARARICTREERYLHAEFTSRVFRFVDDVEFLLEEGLIHVRSASRVGRWDLGANRARVEEIRRRWSQEAEGK